MKAVDGKLADQLFKDCETQEDFNDVFKQLKQRGLEAALRGELDGYLGYEKYTRSGKANSRNGTSQKRIVTSQGEMSIAVPGDRLGEFEPQIIPRHRTRFDGIDEKIVSLYARGLSVRDIQAELSDIYGDGVSTALISQVTDAVLEDVRI